MVSKIHRPILETTDAIYPIITEKTFEQAVYAAAKDTVSILENQTGLSFQDAYRLMSIACNIRISQVVNGVYTLKVQIPKSLLHKPGKSFP